MRRPGLIYLLAAAGLALGACEGVGEQDAASPWLIERVDMRGNAGTGLSLAVGGNGNLAISYYDQHHGDVMFAQLFPEGWRRERVGPAANLSPTNLGVDAAGHPHILHFTEGENSLGRLLAHSWREAGVWRTEVLAAPAEGEWLGRIAGPVFVDGVLHVAYMRAAGLETHTIVHGWLGPDGAWREEVAVARVTPTSDLALLARPDGTLHLAGAMLVYEPEATEAKANTLLVATKTPGAPWRREEVRQLSPDPYALASWWSPRGVRVGAALDPAGDLLLSYPVLDGSTPAVRLELTRRQDGAWPRERVDWVGVVGRQSAVGFGPDGTLWVAYRNGTNQDLKVASRPPEGTWSRNTVDSGRDMGDFPHLALPPDGRVAVVYRDSLAGTVRQAWLAGDGTWRRETVDRQGEVGEFASLGLGPDGSIAIAYYEGLPNLDAKISVKAPGRPWRRERVAVAGDVGGRSRLAVSPTATGPLPAGAAVVYERKGTGLLMAALVGPDGWEVEAVDTESALGALPSVAFTPDGALHVLYLDSATRSLRHGWRTGDGWQTEAVEAAGGAGWGSNLAVGPDGTLHALYLAASNRLLKHAALAPGATRWAVVEVVAGVEMGPRLGLGVAADGTVHASYYDAAQANLLHAWLPPGQEWQTELVDAAGDVGHQNALAVAPDGAVHIAYFDSGRRLLRHAWKTLFATSWSLETVDPTENAGEHPTIAVGPDGAVHIAYRQGDPAWALMYAHLPFEALR